MEELEVRHDNLPATLPELSQFVLIGREKLASVKAEIRAIQKVGLAKEVLEQKRAEAQEIAELVTLSEVQLGRMLKSIPTSAGGDRRSNDFKNHDTVKFEKPKAEAVKELGFNRQQVSEFQRMADHEDIVHAAIAEAKENDDVVSRRAVMKKIEEVKKPHVSFNSGNNEWYTPEYIITAARIAMGSIDMDIASSDMAQQIVQAKEYYTAETNGLDKPLHGNIWLNPPYSSDLVDKFISKMVDERDNYDQAVVLVNNATETEWFERLISIASAVCFPRSRVRFYMPEGKTGAPLQGQAIIYIGTNVKAFDCAFASIGWRGVQLAVRTD